MTYLALANESPELTREEDQLMCRVLQLVSDRYEDAGFSPVEAERKGKAHLLAYASEIWAPGS